MTRFTKLESFSLLFHPFPHGQYVFEPSWSRLDLYGASDFSDAEPPSTGRMQGRNGGRHPNNVERARLPCQDRACNTEFPYKGRYSGEYFTWNARLLSRYLSYLEEFRPDREHHQGFARHDHWRPFQTIQGRGDRQNGFQLSGRMRQESYNVLPGTSAEDRKTGHPIPKHWAGIHLASEDGFSDYEGNPNSIYD